MVDGWIRRDFATSSAVRISSLNGLRAFILSPLSLASTPKLKSKHWNSALLRSLEDSQRMRLTVIAFPKELAASVRAFDLDSRVSSAVALAPASSDVEDAPDANERSSALFEAPQDATEEVGHLPTSFEAGVIARDPFNVSNPFAWRLRPSRWQLHRSSYFSQAWRKARMWVWVTSLPVCVWSALSTSANGYDARLELLDPDQHKTR